MGEVKQLNHSFTIDFRHIHARVTLIKGDIAFMAFIVFPPAYRALPGNFHHALPDIDADSFEEAEVIAWAYYKEYYLPLDEPIRLVGAFNFFVERILFRTAIDRTVGDFTGQFVITRQFYGISENIDGQKYPKTLFDNRERVSTYSALFLINFEKVFNPMHMMGFNGKFIHRLLLKHCKVKPTQLKLFDAGRFVDDLSQTPGRLVNHVADHRWEFKRELNFDKISRKLFKSTPRFLL